MHELFLLIWILVIFVFGLIELIKLHGDFVSFVMGGIGGLAAYFLGYDWIIQLCVFAVLLGIGHLIVRPLIKHVLSARIEKRETTIEHLIGQQAVVTQKIDAANETGRVAVGGHDCLARSQNPKMKYNVADKVTVIAADGATLIVEK